MATRASTGCTRRPPNDVQVSAICDTYQGYIARAQDRLQTIWGAKAKAYVDYRELLADKSIDAVYIMTPEHLHHDMTIAALKAGKHVYIEKPLAHTIEEGFDIVKAWEQAKKIVQVGTQNRSSSLYKKAKELIQQGMVGDVHFVRAFWYRNGLPERALLALRDSRRGHSAEYRLEPLPGHRAEAAWDPHRYFQWRLYWDYSGGISTDLLVHQTDIVNFMLGKTVPKSCMASGGIYRWTDPADDRDVPDCLSAVYDYSDKMQLNYSCYLGNEFFGYGEEIMGNEGTIRVMNRQDLYFEPETYNSRRAERAQPGAGGDQGARRHPYQRTAGVQGKRRRHQPLPQLHPERTGQGAADRAAAGGAAGRHQRPHGHALATRTRRRPSGTRRRKRSASSSRRCVTMAAVATAPAGTSPRWIVNRGVDLSLIIGSALAGYSTWCSTPRCTSRSRCSGGSGAWASTARTSSPPPAARTSIPRRAPATASCSSAACWSSFRWGR